jgi:hypothetical protein
MTRKTYAIAAAVATVMLPMFALTAFAQTTGQTNGTGHGFGNGRGGFHGGAMRGGNRGVFGSVTAISGTTLTVASKGFGANAAATTYTVDASGATVKKAGAASTFSAIAVGDTVMVQGTVSGTSVTATAVNDNPARGARTAGTMPAGAVAPTPAITGNGQPVIMGNVTAVSGTMITITNIGNVSYSVDASSAKVTKSGTAAATVANVTVGDRILVQGTVNGTSITASSVIDQGAPRTVTTTAANGTVTTKHVAAPRSGFFGQIQNFFSRLFGF